VTVEGDGVLAVKRSFAWVCCLATTAGCTSTAVPELAGGADGPDGSVLRLVDGCVTIEYENELIQEVIDLVNEVRAEDRLEPVVRDESLTSIAGDYACEMIEEDFFSHENPTTNADPGERLLAAGYIYYSMGENLAFGHRTAEDVFAAWMESPSHRANILDPEWSRVGMAVRTGGTYGWYWVQEFADPVEFGER
jgi:uncharacterized protein YkwD